MLARAGALSKSRVDAAPQAAQAHGSRNVASGRNAVNGPHARQLYSYIGMVFLEVRDIEREGSYAAALSASAIMRRA